MQSGLPLPCPEPKSCLRVCLLVASGLVDVCERWRDTKRLHLLVDPELKINGKLYYASGKHEHLLGAGKLLAREHEKWVRVDRQRQRI